MKGLVLFRPTGARAYVHPFGYPRSRHERRYCFCVRISFIVSSACCTIDGAMKKTTTP